MKQFFTILFIITNCILSFSQNIDVAYIEKNIDVIIQEGLDSMAFPGAQVLVAKDEKIVFHKTYGYHTYNRKRVVEKHNLYDFASITKVTTGLPILMKLYGEGKFDLDVPLKTYLPDFERSNKKNLTFRNILAHQAGLEPYIVFWKKTMKKNGKWKNGIYETKESEDYPTHITKDLYLHKDYKEKMVKAIKKSKVKKNQGYKYSGLLFLLMPDVIMNITAQDFEKYLYRNIYEPIGATTLTYNPAEKFPIIQTIPTEQDIVFRKMLVRGTVHDEAAAMLGGVSCNAGLFGTAEDLSKLFQLYLNNGKHNGKQIIAEKAVKEFTSYQFKESGNRRGLGFDKPLLEYDEAKSYVAKSASPKSFGHSGFTGTFVWADPKHDLIFIFLSNRVYPSRSQRNLYKLNLRPRMHQVVYDALD